VPPFRSFQASSFLGLFRASFLPPFAFSSICLNPFGRWTCHFPFQPTVKSFGGCLFFLSVFQEAFKRASSPCAFWSDPAFPPFLGWCSLLNFLPPVYFHSGNFPSPMPGVLSDVALSKRTLVLSAPPEALLWQRRLIFSDDLFAWEKRLWIIVPPFFRFAPQRRVALFLLPCPFTICPSSFLEAYRLNIPSSFDDFHDTPGLDPSLFFFGSVVTLMLQRVDVAISGPLLFDEMCFGEVLSVPCRVTTLFFFSWRGPEKNTAQCPRFFCLLNTPPLFISIRFLDAWSLVHSYFVFRNLNPLLSKALFSAGWRPSPRDTFFQPLFTFRRSSCVAGLPFNLVLLETVYLSVLPPPSCDVFMFIDPPPSDSLSLHISFPPPLFFFNTVSIFDPERRVFRSQHLCFDLFLFWLPDHSFLIIVLDRSSLLFVCNVEDETRSPPSPTVSNEGAPFFPQMFFHPLRRPGVIKWRLPLR